MRSSSWAHALLALFMTADRAESIAGDLTEDRARYGGAWFWLHVGRSASQAAWHEFWRVPFASFRLVLASCLPIAAFGFLGSAIVFLTPGLAGTLPIWVASSATWWLGALWAGSSIVLRAPRTGFAVCVTLAVAGELSLGAAAFALQSQGAEVVWPASIHSSAMLAFVPFLTSAARASRRSQRRGEVSNE